MPSVHPDSYLLVTLDSCRYDCFAKANVPNMKSVGKLWLAEAPGYFTYASHMAMFAGFTPGVSTEKIPYVNPKLAKVFKLRIAGAQTRGQEHITLEGRNIMEGFQKRGYETIGTGAVLWFHPNTPAGQNLTSPFKRFYFPGDTWSLRKQLDWLMAQLERARKPVFAFLNIGETHVPYYFEGAPWDKWDNPCVPFSENNRADECWRRQTLALEFIDGLIAPLLQMFENVILCGDHGDCWGEDGLWEHGISHPKTREVPLLLRLTPRS